MKEIVENNLTLDGQSVWVSDASKGITYSDGMRSDNYLERIFRSARDISFTSIELEQCIRDWPSEYHLSRKRAQLLRGFTFNPSHRVLEVGSGCGAISRFLGETFRDVVSIEGSYNRAKLCRLRTRNLANLNVICAPFQDIRFRAPFDLVFCIGVLEYASMFVDADDPYNHVLSHLCNALSSDGSLVLAIENQFGLKYFATCKEDHTGRMFDGIEGYPSNRKGPRTFGYEELKWRLERHFPFVRFYFPYPDYKLPDCVLSKEFIDKGNVAELVGNFGSHDRDPIRSPLFEERRTLFELDRNHMLPFFANSFLVVASKSEIHAVLFEQLGIMYTTSRRKDFAMVTRFIAQTDGSITVRKQPWSARPQIKYGLLTMRGCESEWMDGQSLHTQILMRVREEGISLEDMFKPAQKWLESLQAISTLRDGNCYVSGECIDYIWKNCYSKEGRCVFIDREWEWGCDVELTVLVIRSIFYFLREIVEVADITKALRGCPTKRLIRDIACIIGMPITGHDIKNFLKLETDMLNAAAGVSNWRILFYLRIFLLDGRFFVKLSYIKRWIALLSLWKRGG